MSAVTMTASDHSHFGTAFYISSLTFNISMDSTQRSNYSNLYVVVKYFVITSIL